VPLADLLPRILFLLGLGFLVANLRVGLELLSWFRRRPHALVVWPGRKPPFYGLNLALGVTLGILLLIGVGRLWTQGGGVLDPRRLAALFGEFMMFVYYGYALPLSTRIARGFYTDGIWSDSGFMPYTQIAGLSWQQQGEASTLIVISRLQSLARRLEVPGQRLGEVRRLLHEKIANHAIAFEGGPGLHLDGHDARDDV
jgi:hypothetical protein